MRKKPDRRIKLLKTIWPEATKIEFTDTGTAILTLKSPYMGLQVIHVSKKTYTRMMRDLVLS